MVLHKGTPEPWGPAKVTHALYRTLWKGFPSLQMGSVLCRASLGPIRAVVTVAPMDTSTVYVWLEEGKGNENKWGILQFFRKRGQVPCLCCEMINQGNSAMEPRYHRTHTLPQLSDALTHPLWKNSRDRHVQDFPCRVVSACKCDPKGSALSHRTLPASRRWELIS